jgi:isoleucyl-tRNA synthetase
MAPAFGEDDYNVGQKYGWPLVNPVDAEGRFTEEVSDYAGHEVKKADKKIIGDLKAAGSLIHQSVIQHSYPHCYRCDSPLIYKAISTWFCRIEPIKKDMIKNNGLIHWVPEHLQSGRFGKWLENARDWNLSRNRYWGAPIPVWQCGNNHQVCIGSIKEFKERTGQTIQDLHKHYVDKITFQCPECQETMRRVPEVLDCWFESGSMPYAQNHYPFENKEKVERYFPADFIAEGLDQTRGWFYTLIVLSSALFDKPAFKNVIVNGLILAEDGKKMSKRLKNYPAPEEVMAKYGADAMRLFMINSPVVRAEDLCFSERGIMEMMRSVLIPLWNAYLFFVTYANEDYKKGQLSWQPGSAYKLSTYELDRWIISDLQSLAGKIIKEMEDYHLDRVVPELVGFVDNLTNWYIRRSRERFWRREDDDDKNYAYSTLYEVLVTFCKLLAPCLPFLPEAIYRSLVSSLDGNCPESVHLCSFPEVRKEFIDQPLEHRMALVRQIIFMGRSLRSSLQIKNRQPLRAMTIVSRNRETVEIIRSMENLILQELNLKVLKYTEDEEKLVTLAVKANFKVLGRRFGKEMKKAAQIISDLESSSIQALESGGKLDVLGQEIGLDEIIIQRTAKPGLEIYTQGDLTVVLDTTLDEDLRKEGAANEVINRIQNFRKEKGLNISDHILLEISTDSDFLENVMLDSHSEYIKEATLTDNISISHEMDQGHKVEINKQVLEINLTKSQTQEG